MKHTMTPETGLKLMLFGALAGSMSWGNSSLNLNTERGSIALASETVGVLAGVTQQVENGLTKATTHRLCDGKAVFQVSWLFDGSNKTVKAEAVRTMNDGKKVVIPKVFANQDENSLKNASTLIQQMETTLRADVANEAACKTETASTAQATSQPIARNSETSTTREAERASRDAQRVARCEAPEGRRRWGHDVEALVDKGDCLVDRLANLEDEVEAELEAQKKNQRPGSRVREISEQTLVARLRTRYTSIVTELREIARKLYREKDGAGFESAQALIESTREEVVASARSSGIDGQAYARMVRGLDAVKEAAQAARDADVVKEEGNALLGNVIEAKASGDDQMALRALYDWSLFQQHHGIVAQHAQSSLRQARVNGLLTSPEVSDFSQSWGELAQMIRTSSPSNNIAPSSLRQQLDPQMASALVQARSSVTLPGLQTPNRDQMSGLFRNLLPPQLANRLNASSSASLGVPSLGGTSFAQNRLGTTNPLMGTGTVGFNSSVSTL